jgi:CheY-like chemotaxis protein
MNKNATDPGITRPLVLVVDDDVGLRKAIQEHLEDEGFDTAGASNGEEALNYLADSVDSPAVILLDLTMPVLDGWTFCKLRQGIEKVMDIPVVAISASSMTGESTPLLADAALAKPFDPDELTWIVTRMVGRHCGHSRSRGH